MKSRLHLWISWILTIPFASVFVGTLCIFEVVQRVALALGRRAHEHSIVWLNGSLKLVLGLTAARVTYRDKPHVPADRPLIVLSNHQSLYDIPLLHCFFAERFPRFVAKVELSRWLPSVSYNLKHGENAIINRSNPRQALREISDLGKLAKERGFAAVLFPEGTRARDGVLKSFKAAGVSALLNSCPGALVVPVAIDGSYRLAEHRFLPVPCGLHITLTCGEVLDSKNLDARAITQLAETFVRTTLGQVEVQGKESEDDAVAVG